jgi:hypothetical protein
VAVDLQIPVGVGGEPVVLVPVDDDGAVVPDAEAAEKLLEGLPVDDVAFDGILQVVAPM